MKKTATLLAAAGLALAMAMPAFAQWGNSKQMTFEDGNFNNFAAANPGIAQQLMRNPRLADDPAYLAAHPKLANFIHNYPQAGKSLQSNPQAFLRQDAVKTRGTNPGPVSNSYAYGHYGQGHYGQAPVPYAQSHRAATAAHYYHKHHHQPPPPHPYGY